MSKETIADHVPWNDVHMAELISKENEFPFNLKEVEILSFSAVSYTHLTLPTIYSV